MRDGGEREGMGLPSYLSPIFCNLDRKFFFNNISMVQNYGGCKLHIGDGVLKTMSFLRAKLMLRFLCLRCLIKTQRIYTSSPYIPMVVNMLISYIAYLKALHVYNKSCGTLWSGSTNLTEC